MGCSAKDSAYAITSLSLALIPGMRIQFLEDVFELNKQKGNELTKEA